MTTFGAAVFIAFFWTILVNPVSEDARTLSHCIRIGVVYVMLSVTLDVAGIVRDTMRPEMITVTNEIKIYEHNGNEVKSPQSERKLAVLSHWNRSDMIVLKLGEERITISADDLRAAIANATNTAR